MKKIEVTDEMHAALMELSNEMTTQDNRCTAIPYFFQVQETKKVAAHEDCGDQVYYSTEHEVELRDISDIKEWICENVEDLELPEDVNTFDIINTMDDYEVVDILIENGFGRFYEQDSHEYSNAFFTSKGV